MPPLEVLPVSGLSADERDSAGTRLHTVASLPEVRRQLAVRRLGHIASQYEESRQSAREYLRSVDQGCLSVFVLRKTVHNTTGVPSSLAIGSAEAVLGRELYQRYSVPIPATGKRMPIFRREIDGRVLGAHVTAWTNPRFDPDGQHLVDAYKTLAQHTPLATKAWTVEPILAPETLPYDMHDVLLQAGYSEALKGYFYAENTHGMGLAPAIVYEAPRNDTREGSQNDS